MPLDQGLLEASRRHEDGRGGFAEEFIRPMFGGLRTVAVLSGPLGAQAAVGWVICHSFGREQTVLSRVEVGIARALASGGFPVLRYHGRGYADSDGRAGDVSLGSHVEDAAEACGLLEREAGVRVGTIGIRFGGAVAALVADARSSPAMVLIEPVVRGDAYIRELLRSDLFSHVAAKRGLDGAEASNGLDRSPTGDQEDPRQALDEQGWSDLQGFRLDRRAYEEISGVDLRSDLRRPVDSALLVAVSKGPAPRADIAVLESHLRSLGGACELRLVQNQHAAEFGWRQFVGGELYKFDAQFETAVELAAVVSDWARVLGPAAEGAR